MQDAAIYPWVAAVCHPIQLLLEASQTFIDVGAGRLGSLSHLNTFPDSNCAVRCRALVSKRDKGLINIVKT